MPAGIAEDRDVNAARNLLSLAASGAERLNARGAGVRPGPAGHAVLKREPGTRRRGGARPGPPPRKGRLRHERYPALTRNGEAHVIRNADGVVTDDEIRSLAISQRLLGTAEIILIHHTDCGMLTFTDDSFKRSIQDETGIKPEWAAEAFTDLDEDVRQSVARIKASPFIPRKDAVRGFVFDVATGKLNEVV